MGISLLDCADSDIDRACDKIYDKICKRAENLVKTGENIEREYGIPIINKRISVTPIAMVSAASGGDPVKYARVLDKAAKEVGVNFLGGYSALVQKGLCRRRRKTYQKYSRGSCRNRQNLFKRKYRLDKKQVSIWMP